MLCNPIRVLLLMKAWYQKTVLPRLLASTMSREEFEKIRPAVVSDAHGIVLEIGVGAGNNFLHYKNISKLYALEPSPELVAIAKQQQTPFPVEYLVTGAEAIPLPDDSVDTVVSTWTLCSVDNPEAVLSEIKRVLKPGGRFLFVDHGASPFWLTRSVQTMLTPLTKHFTGNCHMDRDIEMLVTAVGFKLENMSHPSESFKPLVYNYRGAAFLS